MAAKWIAFVASSLIGAFACAQELAPERKVSGHELHSDRDPAVRIGFPAEAVYVGAHRWTLYDVADCEVHVFVEADHTKRVQRLYWIQFEGYVPGKPEAHYDYSSDAVTDFGGRPFHVRAAASRKNPAPRPGSDQEQVYRLLSERGYSLPDDSLNVRLVNVFAGKRKELMVIYAEDLAPTGLAPADLAKGGKAEASWAAFEARVIEAARNRIRIQWQDE